MNHEEIEAFIAAMPEQEYQHLLGFMESHLENETYGPDDEDYGWLGESDEN